MTDDRMRPVVVGLDGSPSAAAAVEFAAAEALAMDVPLRIVHGYVWPLLYACLANVPYRPGEWEPAEAAKTMVNAAARRVRAAHPHLAVETAVASGSGGAVLLDEAEQASLVVIGARGSGGITGVLSGPVAGFLSARAHCPLVIVPEGHSPAVDGGQICVGVDGSAASLSALRVAAEWALRRHASVEAVYAAGDSHDIGSGQASAALDGWIAEATRDLTGVPMRPVIVRGSSPVDALTAAARTARLLVLGGRRHALLAAGLGALGRGVVKRATVPVAIVPATVADAPAPDLSLAGVA
jgi:nucleotide-binding universal stress UspA family protein